MEKYINPHGHGVACNVYCHETTHAVIVLADVAAGSAAAAQALCDSMQPYYHALGWTIIHAKPVEADRDTLYAALWDQSLASGGRGAVTIEGYDTEEQRVQPSILDASIPWQLLVMPLGHDHENGRDAAQEHSHE